MIWYRREIAMLWYRTARRKYSSREATETGHAFDLAEQGTELSSALAAVR